MKQPFFSAVPCGKEGLFVYDKTETFFVTCRKCRQSIGMIYILFRREMTRPVSVKRLLERIGLARRRRRGPGAE